MNVRFSITTAVFAVLLVLPALALADRESAITTIAEAAAHIEAAQQAGASRHAGLVLSQARDRLAEARIQAEEREWTDAEHAALRARVDARLAATKARAVQSEQALGELREAVETLRLELEQ